MQKEALGIRVGRWWHARGNLLVALALVGGVGIFVGRWSRRVPEVAASSSKPAAADSSPSPFAAAPQRFDTAEVPNFKAGEAMRQMDKDIFAALGDEHLDRTRLLDLFPDRAYRVRVIGSVAERRFGDVSIDLNRDKKWDEQWTLKGDEVFRHVPEDPAAGGMPVQFKLIHGRWQPR